VGARPTAIDGTVSSGGGNGGRGNGRGRERMGWLRHFGWSGGAREASRWPKVSRAEWDELGQKAEWAGRAWRADFRKEMKRKK
jgi:hypothetical protein